MKHTFLVTTKVEVEFKEERLSKPELCSAKAAEKLVKHFANMNHYSMYWTITETCLTCDEMIDVHNEDNKQHNKL